MGQDLSGKVAIVTGGASGIGRATAELFVNAGSRVVIGDVDRAAGERVAEELGEAGSFKYTDVANAEEVRGLVDYAVERHGRLDVMFNNAGIGGSFNRFLDDDLSDYERVMAVNLYGVIFGSQEAARHMAANGGGSIINTTSIAALMGGALPIAYRTAKAAVVQFSRSIAIDLADHGIRVNCVAPGHIRTAITSYDVGAVIRRTQPLQRHGSPEDVANVVLFLASEAAAQITGIVVPVDGGTVAGPPINQLQPLLSAPPGPEVPGGE